MFRQIMHSNKYLFYLQFLVNVVKTFCEKFNCLDVIRDVYMWKLMRQIQPYPVPSRPSTTTTRLLALGNFSSTKLAIEHRCTEIYCSTSNKWNVSNEIECERTGFCSVVVNNELYILGGALYGFKEDNLVSMMLYVND